MPKLSRVAAALVGAALLAPVPALAGGPEFKRLCTGDPSAIHRIDVASTYGYYALPAHKPRGIVLFAHGYGHNAEDWREHLTQTAQRDGVIAVAMNYTADEGAKKGGWWVSEGANATIDAAKRFERTCSSAKTIVVYGVSMGGNTSGLAAASHATRSDGSPLFDYWFDIEGATNVIETYSEARALGASGNSFAVAAQHDIEAEMGGAIEQAPGVYASHAVVTRAEDIKASGVKGVVMVHGAGDGLVPYDQSREMQARLRQAGVPVEFYTALTDGGSTEGDTTVDGYVPVNHNSPFAGHGSEGSNTQLVIKTGFDRLADLYANANAPRCAELLVDGTAGATPPVPTGGC